VVKTLVSKSSRGSEFRPLVGYDIDVADPSGAQSEEEEIAVES
jgi:hypothetical protein